MLNDRKYINDLLIKIGALATEIKELKIQIKNKDYDIEYMDSGWNIEVNNSMTKDTNIKRYNVEQLEKDDEIVLSKQLKQ